MFSVWAKLIAFTVQPSAQAVDATSDTYYPTTLCRKYCDRNTVICDWAWGMGHGVLGIGQVVSRGGRDAEEQRESISIIFRLCTLASSASSAFCPPCPPCLPCPPCPRSSPYPLSPHHTLIFIDFF